VTFQLELTATAQRQLGRLPTKVAPAIVEFITGPLLESPLRVGKELQGPLAGRRSARRGVYRVIYRIEEDLVVVLRVDHRANVYRL
jgi:mRNA interferase RelE/StbE